MSRWLGPLRAALDDACVAVPFFIRDDDAGWADDALWPLLDRLAVARVPVDVAVIPAEARGDLVRELNRRRDGVSGGRGLLALHQHGWAHHNHEPTGRKCEFGSSRTRSEQLADLARGRAVMVDAFGPEAGQVFVPPWNRCTPLTALLVRELGFGVLSRDVTAARAGVPGLAELPVTVDWLAKRREGGVVDRQARGELLARAVRSVGKGEGDPRAVGVMLHHAVTGADDLAEVAELAELLAGHDWAAPQLMADLLT